MFLLGTYPTQFLVIFAIVPISGALIGYIKAKQLTDMGEAQNGGVLIQIGKGIGYGLVRIVDVLILPNQRKQLTNEGEAQNGGVLIQIGKGIGYGLIFDLVILCSVLVSFSTM